MIYMIYIITGTGVFLMVYGLLPFVSRWIAGRVLSKLPVQLGERFSRDIRNYLDKARSGVMPELKHQVISHLVEPWIDRFMDKLAGILAERGGEKITGRYGEMLVQSFITKRLLIALVISQIIAITLTLGIYLGKVL